MLENKDYCDYETCVALKEFGYVGICDAYYELTGSEDYNRDSFELLYTRDFIHPDDIDRVAAPLLYQAQKWLREKGIFVHISYPLRVENDVFWNYEVLDEAWDDGKQNPCICASGGLFDSYEEALSEGLRTSIKILQDEQKENN